MSFPSAGSKTRPKAAHYCCMCSAACKSAAIRESWNRKRFLCISILFAISVQHDMHFLRINQPGGIRGHILNQFIRHDREEKREGDRSRAVQQSNHGLVHHKAAIILLLLLYWCCRPFCSSIICTIYSSSICNMHIYICLFAFWLTVFF